MSPLDVAELVDRIWARDPTVWTGTDEASWLGWLDEPNRMLERLDEFQGLDGSDYESVVLLGMGGSSLGPEVLRRTFAIENFTFWIPPIPARSATSSRRSTSKARSSWPPRSRARRSRPAASSTIS